MEKQIQWILSYVQGELAYVWEKNILENLESENLEYEIAEEILANLRKEFRGKDKETVKVAKLKKLEQERKIMEAFVQEFRRAAKRSSYEKRLLIEEFK